MSKTKKKPAPKKDRQATPVIVTASGHMVATKKRIEAFMQKNPDAKIVISEIHHYAMLPFLRVAKDEDGKLHLCTATIADENDWTIVTGEEVRHGKA